MCGQDSGGDKVPWKRRKRKWLDNIRNDLSEREL